MHGQYTVVHCLLESEEESLLTPVTIGFSLHDILAVRDYLAILYYLDNKNMQPFRCIDNMLDIERLFDLVTHDAWHTEARPKVYSTPTMPSLHLEPAGELLGDCPLPTDTTLWSPENWATFCLEQQRYLPCPPGRHRGAQVYIRINTDDLQYPIKMAPYLPIVDAYDR